MPEDRGVEDPGDGTGDRTRGSGPSGGGGPEAPAARASSGDPARASEPGGRGGSGRTGGAWDTHGAQAPTPPGGPTGPTDATDPTAPADPTAPPSSEVPLPWGSPAPGAHPETPAATGGPTGPLTRALAVALAELLPESADATTLADALWLAAAPTPTDPLPRPDERPITAGSAPPDPTTAPTPEKAAPPELDEPDNPLAGGAPPAESSPLELYERLPGARPSAGAPVTVPSGRALPRRLGLAQALRPFTRRTPRGPRQILDLDETLRHSARTGELLPVLRPPSEPWYEILLVVDDSASMAVWEDTIAEFTALLTGLGVFRRVDAVRLLPGDEPLVLDRSGRPLPPARVASGGGRRLVLVVSDCMAASWYAPETWQLLRRWGSRAPVTLVNPLPGRLWARTALDLPAVRVSHRTPVANNRELTFTAPLLPGALAALDAENPGWLALPTLTFSPHALRRWAEGFARGAPEGYDAVLVPPSGVLHTPFADPTAPAGALAPRDPYAAAEAFVRTGSPAAVRLAALCSPFSGISMRLLQLIRQEIVPEAGTGEVAELLTSGVLGVERRADAPPVLVFQGAAQQRMTSSLARRDAWRMHSALSRHIASARPPSPGVEALAVDPATDPAAQELLPASVRPFARASGELLGLLRGGAPAAVAPAPVTAPREEAPPAPLPPLPDPQRSRAVLIGIAPSDFMPDTVSVARVLGNMRSLVTSPDSWNLPEEHCTTLLNPTDADEVLSAVRNACADAEDAVLLYFIGSTHRAPGPGQVQWALGRPEDQEEDLVATVPLDRVGALLASSDTRRAMVILDHDSGLDAMRALRPGGVLSEQGPDLHLLAHEFSPLRLFSKTLRRTVARGVLDGPEFLDLETLDEELRRLYGNDRGEMPFSHVARPGAAPLALARNRAAAGLTPPASLVAHTDLSQKLRRWLRGSAYTTAADLILWSLLKLLDREGPLEVDATTVSSPPDMESRFEMLAGALDFSDMMLVRNLVGEGGPDFFLESTGPTQKQRFPLDVRTHGDLGSGFGHPSYPLSFVLVLLQVEGPTDERYISKADVAVHTDPPGEPCCLVGLRLPVSVPAPTEDPWVFPDDTPTLEDSLRDPVTSACDHLVGQEIAAPGEAHRHGSALDMDEIDIPGSLDSPTVQSIAPDLATLDWHNHEEYEHGLIIGELMIDAEIVIEGYMAKADLYIQDDEVTVLDGDWNDHMAWVCVTREAVLTFHAQVEPSPFDAELELQSITGRGRPRERYY